MTLAYHALVGFIVLNVVMLGIFLAFPQIIQWLPQQMASG